MTLKTCPLKWNPCGCFFDSFIWKLRSCSVLFDSHWPFLMYDRWTCTDRHELLSLLFNRMGCHPPDSKKSRREWGQKDAGIDKSRILHVYLKPIFSNPVGKKERDKEKSLNSHDIFLLESAFCPVSKSFVHLYLPCLWECNCVIGAAFQGIWEQDSVISRLNIQPTASSAYYNFHSVSRRGKWKRPDCRIWINQNSSSRLQCRKGEKMMLLWMGILFIEF